MIMLTYFIPMFGKAKISTAQKMTFSTSSVNVIKSASNLCSNMHRES